MEKKYFIILVSLFLMASDFNIIPVLAQMTIKPDTLPDAVLGESYKVTLYAQPQSVIDIWEISSGSLPPGLTLSKQDSYKAVISGTPSSLGTYQFTVKATKFLLNQPQPIIIYKQYTIDVVGVDIYPSTLPEATENSSYSVNLWVNGGTPPYSWSITGLSTELTNITWRLAPMRTDQIIISGTPLIGSHGNYSIEVIVSDSSGFSASKQYFLNIKEIPWEFSVTIRRLTEAGDAYRALVYIDEFTFRPRIQRVDPETRLPIISEDIFEVTVRRTSGIGDKSVRLDLIALPGEITPPGITMSKSRSTGLVGDEAFVSIIGIKIDTRYPYLNEEHDLQLILRTRVTGVRDDNKTIITTISGIEADVTVSAFPIQVLNDVEELVALKSTIFKVNVRIVCNRQPKIDRDIELDVQLLLPLAEWNWNLPDSRNSTTGFARATVTIPHRLAIDTATHKYVGRTSIYLPQVRSLTDPNTYYTGDPLIGGYYTARYPLSIPQPIYFIPRPTVSYTVQADIENRVRETDEANNQFSSTRTVVNTKSIRILFFPWAENATEKARGLGGRTETSFRRDILIPNARTQVEFLQAIFPTWEDGIRYNIDPTIRIRGLYQTCASQYASLSCSCTDCGHPCNDACRDWCTCSGNAAWSFLYGTNALERMADDAGYDFAIAFRVVGGLGCTWGGRAAYVDGGTADCYSCLSHEMYHALGPMPYDDYSCPVVNQCPEGYWVNNGEHIESGRCYIMSACGGAPWWIQPAMYRRLMYGWFNPSGRDPMAIRVSGIIDRNGTGHLDPFRVRNASRVATPGLSGNYSIVLLNSEGAELSKFGINATFWGEMHTDMYSFMFYVPFSEDVHSIELRNSQGTVLDRRVASVNRPRVNVLNPKEGAIVSNLRDNLTISWEGSDLDGDILYYTVLISPDGGSSWLPIDIDLTTSSIVIDPRPYDPSENYVIKVIVSDGFYSAENISKPFIIGPYVQLKAESPYGGTEGSGWYLVNQTATFGVTVTNVKMEGLLNVLGGYYEFTRWSGDSTSTSPTSTIFMDSDKTVTAVFKANYTMPIIYLTVIIVVLLLVSVIVLRMRKTKPTPPPPP